MNSQKYTFATESLVHSCLPFIQFCLNVTSQKAVGFRDGKTQTLLSMHPLDPLIGSPLDPPGGPRHLQTDFKRKPVTEKAPEISPKRMGFKEISSVFVNGFKEISYRCALNFFQRGTPLIHGSGIFT